MHGSPKGPNRAILSHKNRAGAPQYLILKHFAELLEQRAWHRYRNRVTDIKSYPE